MKLVYRFIPGCKVPVLPCGNCGAMPETDTIDQFYYHTPVIACGGCADYDTYVYAQGKSHDEAARQWNEDMENWTPRDRDDGPGEPPTTFQERYESAWAESREMHR